MDKNFTQSPVSSCPNMWRNFIPTVGQITILKLVQSLSKSRYAARCLCLCVVEFVYVVVFVFVILCWCAAAATLHCIVLCDGSECLHIWCFCLHPCLCCCVFLYLCSSATAATLHCTVVCDGSGCSRRGLRLILPTGGFVSTVLHLLIFRCIRLFQHLAWAL